MELLYLYIKQYKTLRDIGINLSNKYRFHYQESDGILYVGESSLYIQDFFSPNISSLTGIVGENGTGKTTVFRYIMEYLSQGIHNNKIVEGDLLIFENRGELLYHCFKEIQFVSDFSSALKVSRNTSLDSIKSKYSTVLLSNSFDATSFRSVDYSLLEYSGTKNLSTSYLLNWDYQTHTGSDAARPDVSFRDKYISFAIMESTRLVRLFSWLIDKERHANTFPIKPPPYVNFEIVYNKSEYEEQLEDISKLIRGYFNEVSEKNKAILEFFLASVYNWMYEIRFTVGNMVLGLLERFPAKIKAFFERGIYRSHPENSIVPELHSFFYFLIKDEEYSVLQSRIEPLQAFFEKLGNFIFRNTASFDFRGRAVMSVNIQDVKVEELDDLINEYFKKDYISGYINFYFSHLPGSETSLSSGEQHMFSIFARLNSIAFKSQLPLLILLDEAELALHPQWQKEFLSHFIDFISTKFSQLKVQVLITAHSPFILSDIPPNCVVLLEKTTQGIIASDSEEKDIDTFGANIHELFTHSFFIKDGLMGEFARRKISELIRDINEATSISVEYYLNNLKNRIAIIGESFLKSKLLEMVAEKADVALIDQIIEQRTSEIQNLYTIRRKKYDKDQPQ